MNHRRFLLAGLVTLLAAGMLTIVALPSTPREAAAYSPPRYTSNVGAVNATASKAPIDTVGLVDPATGLWRLRNELGGVAAFYYGNPGDYPIMGDWDCDGVDTPGLYRQSDGYVYLRNKNTQGNADIRFFFGNPGDVPIAGDFNGNGCDTVSIYRPSESRVFIINKLGSNDGGLGAAELSYYFGNPGDTPFVGDFNGDGTETIGLYRETSGFVYFRLSHTQGDADNSFYFGDPGDRFVAGDWTGNGIDTPGVFRPSNTTFYFRHSNTQGNADALFRWGKRPWLPVAGTFSLPDDLPIPPPTPPPGPEFQPEAPIRAAFLYPWFPQAWKQGGVFPFTRYTPSLGYYDSSNAATIDQQVSLAKSAGIEAFISSWWGPGHYTDSALGAILDRVPDSPYPAMRLAVYYEEEGQSDPSPAKIVSDLEYLATTAFSDPSYLRVDGKPVIFVWADSGDGAGMARRWKQAKATFGGDLFVVLKVYSGYRSDPNQPDSWHQYAPAVAYDAQVPYSATVSPGFWHVKDSSATLPRDPARFRSDVKRMVGSGAFWQLVTAWNEWGEGTSVEPADEFGTTYIDILADEVPVPPLPPPPSGSVRFTVAGDIGATSQVDSVLTALAAQNTSFHLAVGDLAYSEKTPESAWCDYVKGFMGSTYPFELVSGNHEDDKGPDGFIRNFTACLPDRMGSTGDYGVEYYFDTGPVRVIMIAADLPIDGEHHNYNSGPHRDWLRARIAESEAAGRWTVVGMHKNCITTGVKDCAIGEAMMDDMIARGVDLIVQGHDHTYQRSHQLRCVDAGKTTNACIVDTDSTFAAEEGAVLAITGWVRHTSTDVDSGDPEAGYFAVIGGANTPEYSHGFLTITASATELSGVWTSVGAAGTDSFTIRR